MRFTRGESRFGGGLAKTQFVAQVASEAWQLLRHVFVSGRQTKFPTSPCAPGQLRRLPAVEVAPMAFAIGIALETACHIESLAEPGLESAPPPPRAGATGAAEKRIGVSLAGARRRAAASPRQRSRIDRHGGESPAIRRNGPGVQVARDPASRPNSISPWFGHRPVAPLDSAVSSSRPAGRRYRPHSHVKRRCHCRPIGEKFVECQDSAQH